MVRSERNRAHGLLGLAALVVLAGCDDGVLQGAKGSLSATPSLLNYGPVALEKEGRLEVRIANEGRAPFVVTDLAATVPNLTLEGYEGPFTLSGGDERVFAVVFTPEVEGVVTGAIAVKTDGEGERNLEVFGVGVEAMVDVSQRRLEFGDVELGMVKMSELLVTNPTEVAASIELVLDGENAAYFASSLVGAPVAVEPGEAKAIPVSFTPQQIGLASARLWVRVCKACEPVVVELAGMGISRTVAISPERLNFGRVSVGATAEQRLTITNNGTQPLRLPPTEVQADTAGVFRVAQQPLSGEIAPGASAEVIVAFKPTFAGRVDGPYLRVPVVATNTDGSVRIPLQGEGGGSCVGTSPQSLDFGTVPEGMSVTRRVDVINRCQGAVTITDVNLSGTTGGYFSLGQANATFNVPVGGIVPVKVTYTPKPGAQQSSTSLSFKAWEGASQYTVTVPVAGASRVFQPCSYTLSPPSVDYGMVSVGAEVSLGFSLKNTGTDSCLVTGMDLVSGSDPEFTTTPKDSVTLAPGESTTLPIRFKPTGARTFSGLAQAWVNSPTNGHITVNLAGRGVQSCFALQPSTVDFGTKKLSCGARTRTILAYNNCTADVTLQDAQLTQATSAEFSLVSAPALPQTLQPGQSLAFVVNYQPVDDGEDLAALQVNAGQGGVNTASVMGRGLSREDNTDRFQQESLGKVDVLFVVDNSGSMMEEQQSLGSNFQSFLTSAQAQGIDYQIGVTTTGIETSPGGWSVCPGGAEGGEAGRLFPVDGTSPRIIKPATPNAAQVFQKNTQVGWCHWNEQGLEAAYRALSTPLVNSSDLPTTTAANDGNLGFLRAEAKLAIIFLSDEEDFSTQTVAFYETFLRAAKGNDPSLLSVSAIVGPQNLSTCPTSSSSGTRYIQLAQATGGVVESICTQNWAASLQNLSSNAFGPKRHFPLSETPSDSTKVVVRVNGSQVTTGWTYDGGTNTVVFDASSSPAPGATVEITYPLGC